MWIKKQDYRLLRILQGPLRGQEKLLLARKYHFLTPTNTAKNWMQSCGTGSRPSSCVTSWSALQVVLTTLLHGENGPELHSKTLFGHSYQALQQKPFLTVWIELLSEGLMLPSHQWGCCCMHGQTAQHWSCCFPDFKGLLTYASTGVIRCNCICQAA